MDPETVEAFQVLGKLALIIVGGCTVTLTCIWLAIGTLVHLVHRRERVDELMPLYEAGSLAVKPTVFNVLKLPGHDA